jgi:preprotein translocase subunit YajC
MKTVVLNTKCQWRGCIGKVIKAIGENVTVELNNNVVVECKQNEVVEWAGL